MSLKGPRRGSERWHSVTFSQIFEISGHYYFCWWEIRRRRTTTNPVANKRRRNGSLFSRRVCLLAASECVCECVCVSMFTVHQQISNDARLSRRASHDPTKHRGWTVKRKTLFSHSAATSAHHEAIYSVYLLCLGPRAPHSCHVSAFWKRHRVKLHRLLFDFLLCFHLSVINTSSARRATRSAEEKKKGETLILVRLVWWFLWGFFCPSRQLLISFLCLSPEEHVYFLLFHLILHKRTHFSRHSGWRKLSFLPDEELISRKQVSVLSTLPTFCLCVLFNLSLPAAKP